MFGIFLRILALGLLFYALGKSADVIVLRVRRISERLGLSTLFIGVILGVLTTLPEISIALNTSASGASAISLGNLLGGIPIILGLILGVSVIFNRGVATGETHVEALPLAGFMLLPVMLGLDGRLGQVDGVILVVLYLAYLVWLYFRRAPGAAITVEVINRRTAAREMLEVIAAAIGVLLFSDLLVDITLGLLSGVAIPQFIVGLFVFAVGTNLPEIAVAFRSWRRHVGELSASHLFGSAAANVLVIGLLGFFRPTALPTGWPYWCYAAAMVALMSGLTAFIRTDRRLTSREGFALVGFFLLTIAAQTLFFIAY